MNENQRKIQGAIGDIYVRLGTYSGAVKTYRAEIIRITGLPYVEDEKAKLRATAQQVLDAAAQAAYADVKKILDIIRTVAVEMEQAFAISPELQAAISLVSAVGDRLPYETRQSLVKGFRG